MLVGFDFETKCELDLTKVGPYKYASHPSCDVLMLWVVREDGKEIYWSPIDGRTKPIQPPILTRWLAHNRWFEICIWNKVLVPKYGFKPISIKNTMDSQDQTLMCGFGPNLGKACEAAQTEIKKDSKGKELIQLFCVPPFANPIEHPEEWEHFKKYGKYDVLSMMALHKKLPKITPDQQLISDLTLEINERGLMIDAKAAQAAVKMVGELRTVGANRLTEITDGSITAGTQRERIRTRLREVECLDLPNMQADTINLLDQSELTEGARELIGIYQICGKSSIAKFDKMLDYLCDDGRVHEVLIYHGAQPGRWTSTGPQFHNYPRPLLPKFADYGQIIRIIKKGELWRIERHGKKLAKVDETKKGDKGWKYNPMEVLLSSLRGMIIAAPNKEFYSADYSAIEARAAVWLAGDKDGLQIYLDGRDPYVEIAAKIFNKPMEDVTDEERFTGKQVILQCQYGIGWKKLKGDLWQKFKVKVTAKQAKIMVKAYREKYHKVVECWEAFQKAAISAIKDKSGKKYRVNDKTYFYGTKRFLVCVLPSGRKMYYANPAHRQVPKIWDADKDEWRIPRRGEEKKTKLLDEIKYRKYKQGKMTWVSTYGGSLFQGESQGIAADCMGTGLLNISDAGFPPNLSVHDEGMSEVDKFLPSKAIVKFKNLLCKMDSWADGLPLKVEEWIGPRYRK